MTYKLRFLYAAKAAHPAGAVFATLRLADFCLALTASQTLIRGSLDSLMFDQEAQAHISEKAADRLLILLIVSHPPGFHIRSWEVPADGCGVCPL